MSSRRWVEENREATEHGPTEQRLLVEKLRHVATRRKLTLLDCAIVRNAPFWDDGRTIWELLPTFAWFSWGIRTDGRERTAHQALQTVEQNADDGAHPDDLNDACEMLRYTEWAAEADCFGFDPSREQGSRPRYGVAYWITGMASESERRRNIIDFYLTASSGYYYAWACEEPLHTNHKPVALALLRDIFGNPFRPVAFAPEWRSSAAVGLADSMYAARDFGPMPVLADALEEAGCDHPDVLAHCRGDGPHVRGCWVVDLVLGKA